MTAGSCQKTLSTVLAKRTYSARETAHPLLGVPLVHSSVDFVTANVSEGSLRQLNGGNEDDGSVQVTVKSDVNHRIDLTTNSLLRTFTDIPAGPRPCASANCPVRTSAHARLKHTKRVERRQDYQAK